MSDKELEKKNELNAKEILHDIVKAVRKAKKGRPFSKLDSHQLKLLRKFKLTDRQKAFLRTYLTTNDKFLALQEAGYSCNSKAQMSKYAADLLQHKGIRYMVELHEQNLRERFENEAKEAFQLLVNFMKTDDDPRITPKLRSDIARDLLDRAGYKAVENVKVESHIEVESRTLKEISLRARAMLVEAEKGEYIVLPEPHIEAEVITQITEDKLKEIENETNT